MYDAVAKALVDELCQRLDIEPTLLAAVLITPKQVQVEVFLLNADGQKHIGKDGKVAVGRRSLPFNYSGPVETIDRSGVQRMGI